MRDRYLNGAQGFAIVAVVCGHVLRTTMDAGFVPDGPVAHLLNVLGYAVNAFGFPLFFFVFGLQATASLKHSRLGFLWTTLNTLVYPYVLWSVLQTLVLWTVAQYEGHPFPLSELQRIAWEPVGQFGFLYALCLCHVFAWAAIVTDIDDGRCVASRMNRVLIALLAIACAVPATATDWGTLTLIFRGLVFFMSGVLLARWMSNWIERFAKPSALAAVGIVFVAVIATGHRAAQYRDVYALVAGFAGIATVLLAARWLAARRGAGWLIWLGAAWRPVYLLHVLATAAVWNALLLVNIVQPVVHVVLGTLIGTALPLLGYVLSQRLNVTRLMGFAQAGAAIPEDRPQAASLSNQT